MLPILQRTHLLPGEEISVKVRQAVKPSRTSHLSDRLVLQDQLASFSYPQVIDVSNNRLPGHLFKNRQNADLFKLVIGANVSPQPILPLQPMPPNLVAITIRCQ